MYPFCPATGAPHPDDDIEDDGGDPAQGRSPSRRRRRHTSASGSPDRAGGTQAVYAGAKSAEALRALDKGDWKVLVEVGSCAISFQDCRTGAIVASLDDELERRRWTSAELGKRLEVHQQRMGPLAVPTPAPAAAAAAAAARWSTSLPPAVAQEIQTLLAVVKEKNDHIAKLKVLLKRLVGTASVGLLTATPSAPGGEGGSSVGGALSLWYEPIASSASPSTAAVSAPPTTSVATSFEQRVVELQIELSNRDRRVAQLEEEVHRLRWGSGGEGDRRDGGGEETTASDGSLRVSSTSGVDRRRMTDIDAMRVLENELAETKQMWLLDRRRVQTLHEELQAAQKRKNGMERK